MITKPRLYLLQRLVAMMAEQKFELRYPARRMRILREEVDSTFVLALDAIMLGRKRWVMILSVRERNRRLVSQGIKNIHGRCASIFPGSVRKQDVPQRLSLSRDCVYRRSVKRFWKSSACHPMSKRQVILRLSQGG